MRQKRIELQDYYIAYGDASESLAEYLQGRDYSSIHIIVDENTKRLCLPKLSIPQSYELIEIKSGERNKTIRTAEQIWTQLAQDRVDRHGLVINLGGGVIGDMGGFAAATYMRGIDFVQMPTTLLSQVDASVGGKLAVDLNGLKNYVGLFKNPRAVIVDPQYLSTLSRRELRSGYAEMIKHALIADHDIWQRLVASPDWTDINWIEEIYQSILIKKGVVESDPEERGLRKILNFGHSIGHAIETVSFSTDRPLLHGEAIALGMIYESELAVQQDLLAESDYHSVKNYIEQVYEDVSFPSLERVDDIISILKGDKKNKGGRLLFSLLESTGSCTFNVDLAEDIVRDALTK